MSTDERRRSAERIYQFDESIFRPRTEDRIALPDDEEVIYEVVQPFDQLWIWLLMWMELVILVIALIAAGQAIWTVGLGLGAMTLTMALLSSLKLYTRMDAMGVHFRMRPFHF